MLLCCHASAGEFSFFDNIDIDRVAAIDQTHAENNKKIMKKMRVDMIRLRDKVKFSTEDGEDGLLVDAQKMNLFDIYTFKSIKELFFISSSCCFYTAGYT